MHGMSAVLHHFTVCDLSIRLYVSGGKQSLLAIAQKGHKVVTELEEKREEGQQCS